MPTDGELRRERHGTHSRKSERTTKESPTLAQRRTGTGRAGCDASVSGCLFTKGSSDRLIYSRSRRGSVTRRPAHGQRALSLTPARVRHFARKSPHARALSAPALSARGYRGRNDVDGACATSSRCLRCAIEACKSRSSPKKRNRLSFIFKKLGSRSPYKGKSARWCCLSSVELAIAAYSLTPRLAGDG